MKEPGEAITDPRYIYSDDSNVIAYRLGIVETDIADMNKTMNMKLDRIINEYPTHTMLSLILDPIKTELKELKDKREAEIGERAKEQSALRIAVAVAIISPIATILVTVLLAKGLGITA